MTAARSRLRSDPNPSARGSWDTQTLAETAYKLLRAEVIRCRLGPGEIVSAGQLKAAYGLGASPVREALARLATEGLVSALPRSGYRITPVTLSSIDQLFEAWAVVEPAMAVIATKRITDEQIAELRRACEPSVDDVDDIVIAGIGGAVRTWEVVKSAAGNDHLSQFFSRVQAQQIRLWYLLGQHDALSSMPEMGVGSTALVEAIGRRDPDEVFKLVSDFISVAHRQVMEVVRGWPSVVSAEITPSRFPVRPVPAAGSSVGEYLATP